MNAVSTRSGANTASAMVDSSMWSRPRSSSKVGNVVGSYVAWGVGRYGGQAALRRWGRRIRLREHDLERANLWFERHGPWAVLIGRCLPVVRTFISLPAGIAGMRPLKFGVYTTIGCIPWTAALAGAGYAIGASWQQIPNAFHTVTYIAAAIVQPFVSEEHHWIVKHHAIFQGYYFFHHLGLDRDMREKFRGHPHFETTAEFCRLFDEVAFDANFKSMPLEAFEPMLQRVFCEPRQSIYVPEAAE